MPITNNDVGEPAPNEVLQKLSSSPCTYHNFSYQYGMNIKILTRYLGNKSLRKF